ncbi:uncharacterized protein I206_101938 [Kwoniella pini CBS 10737]|uniref:Uncharacterized protein n=1 Tax=Kwoniella pini CBS 10737 TaxID=1296096 RepID=A0A1B9HVA1_9TREE|nr:uncharacterized protein I206_06971 [Kwoniella pini CBS 10737]OCF47193.1 hypothetical protein I206_06971 [Kwoniella pini CBS 10737]
MSSQNKPDSTASAFSFSSDDTSSQRGGDRSPPFTYEEFMSNSATNNSATADNRNSLDPPNRRHSHLGEVTQERTEGSRPPSYASRASPQRSNGSPEAPSHGAMNFEGSGSSSTASSDQSTRSAPEADGHYGSLDEQVYSIYDDRLRMDHEAYLQSRASTTRRAPPAQGSSSRLTRQGSPRL